jgi:hypothetical protein
MLHKDLKKYRSHYRVIEETLLIHNLQAGSGAYLPLTQVVLGIIPWG